MNRFYNKNDMNVLAGRLLEKIYSFIDYGDTETSIRGVAMGIGLLNSWVKYDSWPNYIQWGGENPPDINEEYQTEHMCNENDMCCCETPTGVTDAKGIPGSLFVSRKEFDKLVDQVDSMFKFWHDNRHTLLKYFGKI